MKLTSLIIQPKNAWQNISNDNPLRAVVKLSSEGSTVECVLSDDTMRRMVDLCATEIAENARRNVADFVAAVSAIDTDKSSVLIGRAPE